MESVPKPQELFGGSNRATRRINLFKYWEAKFPQLWPCVEQAYALAAHLKKLSIDVEWVQKFQDDVLADCNYDPSLATAGNADSYSRTWAKEFLKNSQVKARTLWDWGGVEEAGSKRRCPFYVTWTLG